MTEVFPPQGIDGKLKTQLDNFLKEQDFPTLYREYDWGNDNYDAGFPDILKLETQLTRHAKAGGVTEDDIRDVARWGGHYGAIAVNDEHAFQLICTLIGTEVVEKLPEVFPILLDNTVNGIASTNTSKVLRFVLPEHFGAIDTRCVRVFGVSGLNWVDLYARSSDGNRWYIPNTQRGWPSEYGVWINILRYFAHKLNVKQINCPHPKGFVDAGLRDGNTWTCADVEMALFRYTFKVIPSRR